MEFILTLAEQFWQWTVVIILIIIGLAINIIDRKQINKWRVNFKYDEYPHMKPIRIATRDKGFWGAILMWLLGRRIIGEIPRYISINEYDVSVKKNKSGDIVSSAKAQLEVDGEKIVCEGEGNGPINSLSFTSSNSFFTLGSFSSISTLILFNLDIIFDLPD